MRFHEITLNEAWDANVSAYDFTTSPTHVDVYRNPSKAELLKLIQATEYKVLRGLIEGTDLLVWDAYLTTHGDIQKHYPQARSIYLLLNVKCVEWNDINYENNEEDDWEEYRYGEHLADGIALAHQCPSLVRIYGPDFVMIGIDNDTGENIPMTTEWIAANCRPAD